MYIKKYTPPNSNYTIRYLCTKVDGVEIVLGWLDRWNTLHTKK